MGPFYFLSLYIPASEIESYRFRLVLCGIRHRKGATRNWPYGDEQLPGTHGGRHPCHETASGL